MSGLKCRKYLWLFTFPFYPASANICGPLRRERDDAKESSRDGSSCSRPKPRGGPGGPACYQVRARWASWSSGESQVVQKQARKPRSYASPKLCPLNHLITYLLTGVKCRATSVAKNPVWYWMMTTLLTSFVSWRSRFLLLSLSSTGSGIF